MNKFKGELFLQEFPFLSQISEGIREGKWAEVEIKVGRITTDLLNLLPQYDTHRSSAGDRDFADEWWAILRDGEVIKLQSGGYHSFGAQHTPNYETKVGSVLDQIVDYSPELVYLARKQWESCDWQEVDPTVKIWIYKHPKDDSMGNIVTKAVREARQQVKAELDF